MGLSFAQVITSYNQADRLGRAIDSVLAQSEQPDRIVIGDDGSSDGSPELILRYAEREPRIVPLLSEKNVGIGANLNRCVRAADCDLVSVLAGDDYLLPGKLEHQYAAARRSFPSYGVFYSDCWLEDTTTGRRTLWTNHGREGWVVQALARRRFWLRNFLFPRTLFDEIGGYDESLSLYEDWKFKLELSLRTPVKYCQGTYSVYAQSPDGAHRDPRREHHRCIEKIRDDLCRRYELTPEERRYLDGAVHHFEFMAESHPGARCRAALAAYRCDPTWAIHHARVAVRSLRRRWRGAGDA